MRKFTVHLIIALCTFTLGLAVAFLWSEFRRPSSQSLDEIPRLQLQTCKDKVSLDPNADLLASSKLSLLTYCELVDNTSCYSGKIVRVKAKLSGDDHGMFFYGETCDKRASRTAGRLTGVTPEEFGKLLAKTCGGQCDRSLDVVVVGKFEEVLPSRASNLNWDTTPLHLELLRVEEMSQER
jgi:hypothetical protein